MAAAKRSSVKRPLGFADLPEAAPATTNSLLDFKNSKKNKKRWGGAGRGGAAAGGFRPRCFCACVCACAWRRVGGLSKRDSWTEQLKVLCAWVGL